MLLNRFSMVPVDSSAASRPLPGATMATAVSWRIFSFIGVVLSWRSRESFDETRGAAILRHAGGGEGGIRTPEPLRVIGFQDRRNRPLCHLSVLAAGFLRQL